MRCNSALVALMLAGLAGLARPARADQADSRALFEEGVKLRKAGRCAEAITAFTRALEVWPAGIGARRNIALCQEALGQYASSRRSWWELRREALASGEAKYDGWEGEAQAAYDRLEALVPYLTVRLEGAGPEQVIVRVEGRPLAQKLIGVELERNVGSYRVEAWLKGKRLALREVDLGAAEREEVTLNVQLPKGMENSAAGPDPLFISGLVAVSLGTLSVGGAIASAVIRGKAITELEDTCPNFDADTTSRCPEYTADARDRGELASIMFNVFGIAAIAGIGAGVPMMVVATLDDAPEGGKVSLLPTPGGALLKVTY